jgi:hypothetical protein
MPPYQAVGPNHVCHLLCSAGGGLNSSIFKIRKLKSERLSNLSETTQLTSGGLELEWMYKTRKRTGRR